MGCPSSFPRDAIWLREEQALGSEEVLGRVGRTQACLSLRPRLGSKGEHSGQGPVGWV